MLTEIKSGDYIATVTSDGGGLVSLEKGGVDLVVRQDRTKFPLAFQGDLLAPWLGRMKDATYSFEGVTYTAPVNDTETGAALHGLVAGKEWTTVETSDNQVVYELVLGDDDCYPFKVRLTSTYSLDGEGGLTQTVTAVNEGETPAPFSIASHPYLTCGGAPIERCVLSLPAVEGWQFNERKLPGEFVDFSGTERDFSGGRAVADTQVDHMYLADFDGPSWTAELRDPETGVAVELEATEKWIQVFTADGLGRGGVAVEPLNGTPNAFNTGLDLLILEPGQTTTYEYSIRRAA